MARTTAVIAAVSLALAGCGTSEDGSSDGEEYYILGLLGTSGLNAPSGQVLKLGVEAAVEVANEAGGLDGREVTVKFVDTQSDPSHAVSALREELVKRRPDLIYAGSSSTEVVALLPSVTQEKIPFVTNTVASDIGIGDTNPYSFSSIANQDTQAAYFSEFLASQDHSKIGVIYPDIPAGTTANESYTKSLEGAGFDVVSESYKADALDMTAPLARLESSVVDAVIFWSVGPAGGYIIKSRAKIGMTTPFYGDTAVATANVASAITAEEGEGVELATWKVNLNDSEAEWTEGKKTLIAQLAKDDVEYKTVLGTYAMAYDAIMLGLNGAVTAGGDGAEAWTKAMIAQGSPTFATAISSSTTGWTPENRFRRDMGAYVMIPAATRLEGGMFASD